MRAQLRAVHQGFIGAMAPHAAAEPSSAVLWLR
jgi:hypothetical protein